MTTQPGSMAVRRDCLPSDASDSAHFRLTEDRPKGTFDSLVVNLVLASLREQNNAADFIPAYGWEARSDLQPNDILEVDYSCRRVDADGVFLIETTKEDGDPWRGCKRFSISPRGIGHQHLDDKTWNAEPEDKQVLGRLIRVYRARELA